MAFAGAFSPTFAPLPSASAWGLSRGATCVPSAEAEWPPEACGSPPVPLLPLRAAPLRGWASSPWGPSRAPLQEPPGLDLDGTVGPTEDAADVACQFAPLLSTRRAQALEAAASSQAAGPAAAGSLCGDSGGGEAPGEPEFEARLSAALDAMDVLRGASKCARALGRRLSGSREGTPRERAPGEEAAGGGGSSSSCSPPPSAGTARARAARRRPAPPARWSGETPGAGAGAALGPSASLLAAVAGAAASAATGTAAAVAGALLFASAGPAAALAAAVTQQAAGPHAAALSLALTSAGKQQQPLCMAATAAAAEAAPARPPACVEGLLRLDGDLLEADSSLLRETLHVVLLRLLEPLVQVEQIMLAVSPAADGPASGGVAFTYWVNAVDPHDAEPLRELLLLEAESGGARKLLPLLCEQLCDDGLPTPRHLKVRVEVRGATM